MRKAGDTNMGKNFNINLKEARLRAGFSQKEIAEKIGVAKSTYSLYENGHREPNICTIKKLAEFLHVSIDVLFDFQDKSTPSTALLNVNDLTDIELKNIQNSKGNKCMFFNSSLLGKRIKSLREDHDLTQKELSLMIGLTPKMISFYENNQRTRTWSYNGTGLYKTSVQLPLSVETQITSDMSMFQTGTIKAVFPSPFILPILLTLTALFAVIMIVLIIKYQIRKRARKTNK